MDKFVTIKHAVSSYDAARFATQRDFIGHLISFYEEGNRLAKGIQDRSFLNPGVVDISLGMSDLATTVLLHADKVRELGNLLTGGFLSHINSFVVKSNANREYSYLFKPYDSTDYVSNLLSMSSGWYPDVLLTSMLSLSDFKDLGWISESEYDRVIGDTNATNNGKYFMAYSICSYAILARYLHTMFVTKVGNEQKQFKLGEMGEVMDYHHVLLPIIGFSQESSSRNGVTYISNKDDADTKYWPYPAGVITPIWAGGSNYTTVNNRITYIQSNFIMWLAFTSLFADQPRLVAKLRCMREMYNDISELILSFANAGFTQSASEEDAKNWVTNFIRSNMEGTCYYRPFKQFSSATDPFLSELSELI